jgi:hypothetical protein
MTQVPCEVETPRLPAMVGTDTLAMVESSTCMKVPRASAMAVTPSVTPVKGAAPAGALAEPPDPAVAEEEDMISPDHSLRRKRPGCLRGGTSGPGSLLGNVDLGRHGQADA